MGSEVLGPNVIKQSIPLINIPGLYLPGSMQNIISSLFAHTVPATSTPLNVGAYIILEKHTKTEKQGMLQGGTIL